MTDIAIALPTTASAVATPGKASPSGSSSAFANLMKGGAATTAVARATTPAAETAPAQPGGKVLPVALAELAVSAELVAGVSADIQTSLAAFLEANGIPSTTTQIPDEVMDAWITTELPLLAQAIPELSVAINQLSEGGVDATTETKALTTSTGSTDDAPIAPPGTAPAAAITPTPAIREFIAAAVAAVEPSHQKTQHPSLTQTQGTGDLDLEAVVAEAMKRQAAPAKATPTAQPSELSRLAQALNARADTAAPQATASTSSHESTRLTAGTGYTPLAALQEATRQLTPTPQNQTQAIDDIDALLAKPAPAEARLAVPTQRLLGDAAAPAEVATEGRLMAARIEASVSTPVKTEAAPAPLAGDTKLPHFDDPAWLRSVGEKAQMMLRNAQPEARLRLDPSHLGTIEMRISQGGDGTQITMVATDGRVRDALEAGQNRLREQLAEQGVELSKFDVSDQSQQESQRQQADGQNEGHRTSQGQALADGDSIDGTENRTEPAAHASDRLVDQRV